MEKEIQIKDKRFALYIPEELIKARVKEVAREIGEDLKGENPLFLVILNGAFIFAADLLRELDFPCEVTFVRVSSYEGTGTTGEVKQLIGLKENICGRKVVIVEDIVETGYTMQEILRILADKNPDEVLITSLFVKPDCLKVSIDIRYRCFDIGNDFIVGYGLDYNQAGRNLPHVYQVVEQQ